MPPTKNLRQVILRKSLPPLMALVAVCALILLAVAMFLVNQDIENRHAKRISEVNKVYRQALISETDRLTTMASNPTVITALSEVSAMNLYFLRNFLKAQPVHAHSQFTLTVFDRRGILVASNNPTDQTTKMVNELPWINSVLIQGEAFQQTTAQAVLFAVPVRDQGEIIGALYANYDNLMPFLDFQFEESIVLITNSEERIFYSSDNDIFQVQTLVHNKQLNEWRIAFESTIDNLYFYGLEKKHLFYQETFRLIGFIFFSIIAVVVGTYFSANAAARLTTGKMAELLTALEQFRTDKNTPGHTIYSPVIEFDQLKREFQFLLDRVDESTHSTERVMALLNSLDELLVAFDLHGQLTLSNHAFAEFRKSVGFSENELLTTLFFGIEEESLLDHNEPLGTLEKHYLLKSHPDSRSYVVIHWTRHIQFNDQGDITGLIFVGMDMTRAIALQTELKLKEAAIDGAENGIIIVENQLSNALIIYANKGIEKLTGIAQTDLLGDAKEVLSNSLDNSNALERVRGATRNRHPIVEILQWKSTDGTIRHLELSLSPVNLPQQQSTQYFLGFLKDVTEQQLTSNLLIEAKQKAEESAQMKSSFLASMSHEIRTPMNGVIGMLDILRESPLDEQQINHLNIAQSSAQSLLAIINDILDFSKVEAGKLTLEEIEFDIRDMLEAFIDSMAHQAHMKNLELVLDANDIKTQFVKGDPGRLRQILTNLVGNAVKFTQQGEVVVHAKLTTADDQSLTLEVSVRDTGAGIPHEKQAHLFDPFTQVDGSHRREQQGTGLGLAIVKQLCEAMNGHIWLSSEVDSGSVFGFHVQLAPSTKKPLPLPTLSTANKKVMVVDDNASNVTVLSKQLENWGVKVVAFTQAKVALTYLQDKVQRLDAAIIDSNMPDLDGTTLCRLIREMPDRKDLKLILMTSIGQRGDAQHFADIGFNGYFPKPATSSDIIDALTIMFDDGEALNKAFPLVTQHYVRSLRHDQKLDRQYRVLLVEDNSVNQIIAKKYILSIGLEASVAENGQTALETLKKNTKEPFDLILMDCQMPVMDGFEATRNIRNGLAGEAYLNTPIIAMTANAMKGDRENCLDAGMDDYISKPIRKDVFSKVMKNWLSR